MKTLLPNRLAPLGIALALALAGVGPVGAQTCLDNRDIQEAVSSGRILSLDAVLAAAGIDGSAEILNVAVCDEGGGLVYVIGLLTASGDAQNLVLSAQ